MKFVEKFSPVRIFLVALIVVIVSGFTLNSFGLASVEKILGEEESMVVQLVLKDRDQIDILLEEGVDIAHRIHEHNGHIDVDAVVTASELKKLKKLGIGVKDVMFTESDFEALIMEQQEAFTLQAEINSQVDNITMLRANHFTNQSETFLYVEAKTSGGEVASTALTASWENGEGEMQTATLSRKIDVGHYMYHLLMVPVAEVPSSVTISSSLGGEGSLAVTEWIGGGKPKPENEHYVSGFVDHYMNPTELYERIEALAAEFPELAEIIELPNETDGYSRHAMATIGGLANNAVVVTSNVLGHLGGNDVTVQFINPGVGDSPLSVSVSDIAITVSLATNSSGALTSNANQVAATINANASNLVSATTYRGNTGNGIVPATGAVQNLSDYLSASDDISRDPMTVKAIRIGKHRDGSKIGVLAYAQEHAREWVTPLVTIETAERLLRNYAHDADTKKLLNNLDIFIVPSVNPDGSHYSFFDFAMQRKSMTNYCGEGKIDDPSYIFNDPGARNFWGVDINRNYAVGSMFDGYHGASSNCTSGTYAGPAEHSEPESANVIWLAEQNKNIKFSMNIHSFGGYFMWAPGSYVREGRETLPRPTAGEEEYFWQASETILNEIKKHRGTVIVPSRTGPTTDVLYSAAGNSSDELWYDHGIYAWNFEVGADLWNPETKRWEAVGFQPPYAEGHEEAMEFSNGLIGLLKVAYDYDKDHQPPKSELVPGQGTYSGSVEVKFDVSKPATVYYTMDGSRPTFNSPKLQANGMREEGQTFKIDKTTTINWFAVDAKGNVEKNYNPDGKARNYNSAKITIRK